jgi:hypothetical protein
VWHSGRFATDSYEPRDPNESYQPCDSNEPCDPNEPYEPNARHACEPNKSNKSGQ